MWSGPRAHAFALLLERHRGPVIHFLYRMVQNQSVSEELAQEVFLRVYRSRTNYEPAAKFTTSIEQKFLDDLSRLLPLPEPEQ